MNATLKKLDSLIRSAEKDDVLLYITAFLGVVTPGLVYISYRFVHQFYANCAKVGFALTNIFCLVSTVMSYWLKESSCWWTGRALFGFRYIFWLLSKSHHPRSSLSTSVAYLSSLCLFDTPIPLTHSYCCILSPMCNLLMWRRKNEVWCLKEGNGDGCCLGVAAGSEGT